MDPEVKCPSCGESFAIEEGIRKNDTVYCDSCYAELLVVSINPPVVEEIDDDMYELDEDYLYGNS